MTTRRAEDILLGWGTRPDNWQLSAQIQHELRPGMGVNVGYFRTSFGNFTATDNLAVTPADYEPVLHYGAAGSPAARRGR